MDEQHYEFCLLIALASLFTFDYYLFEVTFC